MKMSVAIGAQAHLNTPQPPAIRNTPASAGTNVYMSIVTMLKRAHTSRRTKLATSRPSPVARADDVTVPIGCRHQKISAAVQSGTIHPWEYCGLSQLDRAFSRPGQ